jgi:hypothetical protein
VLTLALAAIVGLQSPWISLRSDHGVSWLDQGGHPFWSFGVDCVEDGVPPNKNPSDNPSYSGLSLFPNEKAWVTGVQDQLRNWGFNSLGAWSDAEAFRKYGGDRRLPYAVCLHLGSYDKAPWNDLFSPEMASAMDGAAKTQIPHFSSDPYLIGYFSDNELGWWDDTLFLSYLHLPADSPGREAMTSFLKTTYHGSIDELRRDWITDAPSIDSIKDLKLRPGSDGRKVLKKWIQMIAEQYYKLARDSIRRYDPNHLILGDRYCQYYSLPVVRASAKYVDVVSTNYGSDWNDGSITPFFLNTLNRETGKPVMVTEFYMASVENRSGDQNTSGGFPTVQTQPERAASFANYVKQVAQTPCTVGAHWFQYYDEPGKGRGDGENYNMGLVDIHGKPYEEITSAANAVNPAKAHAQGVEDQWSGRVPLGPQHPMDGLKDWHRESGCVPASGEDRIADLYACCRPEGLYLGLYSMDFADKSLYEGGTIPEKDRCHFSIDLGNQTHLDVRFGADLPTTLVAPSGCTVTSSGGLKESTIVFIPTRDIPGQGPLHLNASFQSHGRGDTMAWSSPLELAVFDR